MSEGLAAQTKDGVTDILTGELNRNKKVAFVTTSKGILLPGEKTEFDIKADPRLRLSLSAMLARTNDALIAGRNLRLPRKKGSSVTVLLTIYDAGAEINTESCDHIPAPPCNSPNVSPDKPGEGFAHLHPGVFGVDDLEVLRDTFGREGAQVTITRK